MKSFLAFDSRLQTLDSRLSRLSGEREGDACCFAVKDFRKNPNLPTNAQTSICIRRPRSKPIPRGLRFNSHRVQSEVLELLPRLSTQTVFLFERRTPMSNASDLLD